MAKEDVVKMPPVSVLKSLIAKSNAIKTKTGTLNGELGEAIAAAVENHNVHAAAFKLINKLQRMDAVKLMSFLTHFDAYREKLGIDKLAAEDLPGMDDDGETDAPAATSDLDENGRPKPMFDETKAADKPPASVN